MSVWEIIGGIILIILSIVIVVCVLMQESPKGGSMNALTGGSDSFYNKNPGRTLDALLYRTTKYAAIGFFVVTLLVYAAVVYLS